MRKIAATVVALSLGLSSLAACQKPAEQNQDLAVDENASAGEIPANAEIETLPADESSVTPSGQLQNGYDNAEGNAVSNSD